MSDFDFTAAMEAVLTAPDAETAWTHARRALEANGIDQAVYCYVDFGVATPDPARMTFLSNMSTDWLEHYVSGDYAEHDAGVLVRGAGDSEPIAMGERILKRDHLSKRSRAVMEECVDAGMRSGINLVFPSTEQEAGEGVYGFTIGSSLPVEEMDTLLADRGRELTLIGRALHAVANESVLRRAFGIQALSPREADCLRAVIHGDRVARIADQLGIQPVTVNLHLRNARRKLDARTLPEAVAKAVRFGLLEL